MYCENKSFACDVNVNGSKNVKNQWEKCPANPASKSKWKQVQLVFDFDGDEGEAQVKIWVLNLNEARDVIRYNRSMHRVEIWCS